MAEISNISRRVDPSSWLVENLRVTLFTFPEEFSLDKSYWQDLVGQPPEKRVISPKNLQISEEGRLESAVLKFGSNPTRIDWVLTFSPNLDEEKNQLSVIGPLGGILNMFTKLMRPWLSNSPRSSRLAFGAVLHLPVDNREEGYRKLAPYLEAIKLDPIGSSDFSYQINRPRNSSTIEIPNFKINRLTRWSVVALTPIQIEFSPEKVSTITAKEEYYCRLELDINTLVKFEGELPKEKIPALFNELVDMGMEIVKEGDIP